MSARAGCPGGCEHDYMHGFCMRHNGEAPPLNGRPCGCPAKRGVPRTWPTRSAYLASRYSRHPEMREVRAALEQIGITVTSRWIDCHTDVVGDFTSSFTVDLLNERPHDCAPLGQHDLDDINAADTVISFTTGDGGKGGRHVEFGYGLALGKRSIVVGPREHVFHTLDDVEWFSDLPALLASLGAEVSGG